MRDIKRLLVANRGEIAIRIFRAATELNIKTIAIFTYEDRYSLHRYKADEAYQIGADTEPLKPYLNIDEIIKVALKCKADAIHPGYGFLAENVEFAKRCRENGIIFVGPSTEAMQQLGDKIAGKELARKLKIPIIEDNKEKITSLEIGLKEAKRIGFPVIIKASAGGGGRGMRVAYQEDDFKKIYSEARNEAKTAFGDDTIFIEKFIPNPKHIEVQLLGDQHGNLVHLFERDCSVQRRFQKVIEVAPAPNLFDKAKEKLYEYALRLGKAVNYDNAGTVEFLVDAQENIYFIEVNPRIQVEHTVTEEITRIDIVRAQILVAMGHPLSFQRIAIHSQEEIKKSGFAIQCRITTEDPENNFKPDYGTIIAYRAAGGFAIRLDEGNIFTGSRISPFFDPMLVKVTASGRTLKGACNRMSRTLLEFRIRGVKTNIPFLENVLLHPVFQQGKATVKFIDEHPELFSFSKKQDRGTKLLAYVADVIVNGNPDLATSLYQRDGVKNFEIPKVPEFDKYAPYPKGTKNLLTELGREKFIEWIKSPTPNPSPKGRRKKVPPLGEDLGGAVFITDTTFRDAHQSLLATRFRTIDMLRVAESFAKNHPQLFSMEVWGGATFDVALRFLHECPWKRLQLFREAVPNILLQMLIRGNNAVGYSAYPDNLIEKFIEKAWENGIDIFRIFDSLNWLEAMKVSIRAVRERTDALAEGCICYTGDILNPERKKYNLQYYLDLAKQIEDEGAHILAIKDMAGLLKPLAAEALISNLKKHIHIPIHLHTHDTSSLQSATYLKAVEAGVDIIDCAISSVSGLTSQPNLNAVAEMLKDSPRRQEFNMESLNRFSDYWEKVRKYYFPFESGLQAGTAEIFQHEMPGGQYTNLQAQAVSLRLGHKWEDIKKSYRSVNDLFGDIVKVTPSSKVVGDMALYMTANSLTNEDIYEKGETFSFPESVRQFFRGDLGQVPGGFNKKLQKIILKNELPLNGKPNGHLPPVDFEKEFDEFQKKYKEGGFLDFLSYKFFPKVYEDYYKHLQQYSEVSYLPTPAFYYGLQPNEEILVEIAEGKTLLVRFLNMNEPDENGMRKVFFSLNGQARFIEVKDKSVQSSKPTHKKISSPKEIGTPLQGMIRRIFVKEGESVKKNGFLFTIEAMKMETTITAPHDLKVKKIVLGEGTLVEGEDVVMEVE